MPPTSPIGVFDSGFGGLSVFDRIRALLPGYDYVYLGDNARTPYGNRSFEAVLGFTTEGVEALFAFGCPLIVIACNTASAKALRSIQQFHLPRTVDPTRRVLGVIRPTVEALGEDLEPRTVALWGTKGTVRSDSFAIEVEKHAPRVRLIQQACPLLVPLVEEGELDGEGLDFFIRKYWRQTVETAMAARPDDGRIDSLLLACTHYPLLKPRIRAILPAGVRIVSQDDLVAPSLAAYLARHPEMEERLSRGATCRFLTTDACEHFDKLAEIFVGHPIASQRVTLS